MSVLKYKDADGNWKVLQNASANEGVYVGTETPQGNEVIWINPNEAPYRDVQDYIIQQGSADGWNFLKTKQGVMKCWRSFDINAQSTGTIQIPVATYPLVSKPLPAGFTEINTCIGSTKALNGDNLGATISNLANNGLTAVTFNHVVFYSSAASRPSSVNFKTNITVIGRWK